MQRNKTVAGKLWVCPEKKNSQALMFIHACIELVLSLFYDH